MLVFGRLFHKISQGKSLADDSTDTLKEKLRTERGRGEDLTHEILNLKQKCTGDLHALKSKLACDKQISSVLRRSFTMRTVEECWNGKLTERPDFERGLRDKTASDKLAFSTSVSCGLKPEITDLERRLLDLEEENYELLENNKALAAEIMAIKKSLVRTRQSKEAYERQQMEETCRHLEAICLENKTLRTHKNSEVCLQSIIDSLSKDRESLCQELTTYSDLMRSERAKYEAKLNALTEASYKQSQELQDSRLKARQDDKVGEELRKSLSEMRGENERLDFQLKLLQKQLMNKDCSIERLENEISKEAEIDLLSRAALMQAKKENIMLTNELRTLKANYEASEATIDELRGKLSESNKELRGVRQIIERKADEVRSLMEELDIGRETANELKEKIGFIKEDFSKQLSGRLKAALHDDKMEAEDCINHDETTDTKSLFEHSSLHEELAELVDFIPARVSSLFNSFEDCKKLETLHAELMEKDAMIENLTRLKDELQCDLNMVNKHLFKVMRQLSAYDLNKEAEVSRYRELIFQLQANSDCKDLNGLQVKVLELQTEVDRLRKTLANEGGAEEIERLKQAVRDSEFKVGEVRMQYFEVVKELKGLEKQLAKETKPTGAMSRIGSIFRRG
jgi:chromosome segregation ATPase